MAPKETNEKTPLKHQDNIQRLSETSFHEWYRMVFAFSDQITKDLVSEWGVQGDDLILDPFVGTGTTAVAAKKLGIDSIGFDVMPPSVLATRAKTNWQVDLEEFRSRTQTLKDIVQPVFREIGSGNNQTLDSIDSDTDSVSLDSYSFEEPEKLPKGWLSEKPLKKMLVLKEELKQFPDDSVTDLLELAVIAILPENVANVGFGPEAYKVAGQDDVDVLHYLSDKLQLIERDLCLVQEQMNSGFSPGTTEVFQGDAREIEAELEDKSELLKDHGGVDYVMSSPPYPAEHDYTRNQRLELVWMDEVTDRESLQEIKKDSIRSNTKNIYVGDDDGSKVNVRENEKVDSIVTEMEEVIEEEDISHGFGNYYPRVIEEYFGGMTLHLQSLYEIMAPGGHVAYVVADQASYWQIEVPTGTILSELASAKTKFQPEGTKHWRNVVSTTGKKEDLSEEILVLNKPA